MSVLRFSGFRCSLPEKSREDGGYAMAIAVIAASLMVSVATALVLSLASSGSESARQREIYTARATGTGALDYMMHELRDDADLFKDHLANSPPSGPVWLEIASTPNAPDPDLDSDWYRLSDGTNGDLSIVSQCSIDETCWTLRWSYDTGSTDPNATVVEAIVRYNCKGNYSCSLRYFQQRLVKESSDWRRLDVTEVTGLGALG